MKIQFHLTPFPPHKKKRSFPMFTVFWVLKTWYHELIFFWQAAMFSYTSIIWRKDGISVLLLLCLWVKCPESRCRRETAANANARRRTRGTRRRHAWRDKVHFAHLLLTDARSTAYPVGHTLYCFCARICSAENQSLMPVSGWILPKPCAWTNSRVFANF